MTKMDFATMILDRISAIFDRLRPNVIIIAVLVTWLLKDYGDALIKLLPKGSAEIVLTSLITTGVAGLIIAMQRMFEQASVPADTFERVIERVARRRDE